MPNSVNSFTVSASSNGLTGFVSGALSAGEVKHLTIQLQPTASITGTLFMPDGQTPATTGSVAPSKGARCCKRS